MIGEWIPCSERLPEKSGMYLVTQQHYDLRTNSKKLGAPEVDYVMFDEDGWRRARNIVVIAWMPLPKPYEQPLEKSAII